MRASAIVGEAWRNLATGTARAGVLGLVTAVLTGALALLDVSAVVALQRQATDFREAGASVNVLAAEKQVSGQGCEALARVAGVRSAGALRTRPALTLSASPRSPLPAYEGTPALAAVLNLGGTTGLGVWVSRDLADRLAVRVGDRLPTTEGELTVAAIFDYPADGRDQRLVDAVVVPVASGAAFDECWATVWPSSKAATDLMRSALLPTTGVAKPASLALLNNGLGPSFDGATLLAGRPTGPLGFLGAGLTVVLGFVAARLRRLEFASALHAGQSKAAQLALAGLEAFAWGVGAALLAVASVYLGAVLWAPAEPRVVAGLGLGLLAATPLAAVVGTLLGVLPTRESHLFRYFKDR